MIAEGWKHTYEVISKQAILPICVIQILMVNYDYTNLLLIYQYDITFNFSYQQSI